MPWTILTCRDCRHSRRCTPEDVLAQLQQIGMLRREKEPPWELVSELLTGAADQLICQSCGGAGLSVADGSRLGREQLDEFDDWGPVVRSCEACGERIPSERLEIFPDVRRCAACQQANEQQPPAEEDDFCPRCGAHLTVRSSGASGLTRYVSYCPDCRK